MKQHKVTPKADYKFLRLMGFRYILRCKKDGIEPTRDMLTNFLIDFHGKYLTQKIDFNDLYGALSFHADHPETNLERTIECYEKDEHLILPRFYDKDYRKIDDRIGVHESIYIYSKEFAFEQIDDCPDMGIIQMSSLIYNDIIDGWPGLSKRPFRDYVQGIVVKVLDRIYR